MQRSTAAPLPRLHVAWNTYRPLAAVTDRSDVVRTFDVARDRQAHAPVYSSAGPSSGAPHMHMRDNAPHAASPDSQPPQSLPIPMMSAPTDELKHRLQRRAVCAAWRPSHGTMLAVGCLEGVALWRFGRMQSDGEQRLARSERGTALFDGLLEMQPDSE